VEIQVKGSGYFSGTGQMRLEPELRSPRMGFSRRPGTGTSSLESHPFTVPSSPRSENHLN